MQTESGDDDGEDRCITPSTKPLNDSEGGYSSPETIDTKESHSDHSASSSGTTGSDFSEGDHDTGPLPPRPDRFPSVPDKGNYWNTRYQQILLLPKTTAREKLKRAVELKKLYDEFDESAVRIAKELVAENESLVKKYPPVSTSGVAGGQKFIVNGILFKFARDWKQIYGGDSNAAKAAGHELLCVRSVLQLDVPDIFTPLMTLVDYAGFRITAVSLLPIDSTTLVYGSDNGGKTVVSKSQKVTEIMEYFAQKLNLKAHAVSGVRLFTPGDLEAHHGFDDKDYIVDTTRLFPCQTPFHSALFIPADESKPCKEIELGPELFVSREKWSRVLEVNFREEEGSKNIFARTTSIGRVWSEVSGASNQRATALVGAKVWGNAVLLRKPKAGSLYRMLRPELVRENEVPLSSDAWTTFQSGDPEREAHNREVDRATQRLLLGVIPRFAEELQRHTATPVNHNELARLMHRHGINIRFLGLVRRLLARPHLKSFLLTDMVSRVIKEKLRGELRVWVGFEEESRRRLVVDYFNRVFGRSSAAADFWRLEVAVGVQHKFIHGLAAAEAMPAYDIRQDILMFSLFNRVSEIAGVRFKPGTYKRLFEHPFLFDSSAPFTYGDLAELSAAHRNASVISEDMGPLIRAAVAEEEAPTLRLLEQVGDSQALAAFEAVCQVKTHRRTETILGADSKEAVASLFDLARTHLRGGNNTMALDAAIRGLSYGEVLFGTFSEVALNGAVLLGGIYQRMGDLARAMEYYGRALDAVQRLYKRHPLVGTLTSRLYFCSEALARKSGVHTPHDLLRKSYASFCEMYGREAAVLLLPLLGYEQSDPAFASVMQDLVLVQDEERSLVENSKFLWPPALYESLGKVVGAAGGSSGGARLDEMEEEDGLQRKSLQTHFLPQYQQGGNEE